VDATSTATATQLTREQLEVLPTSRDGFHAFLSQTPGVRTNLDVGASGLGDTVEFRLYGQLGSPWQMVEGVLASAPTLLGAQGSHVDFNAIDGTRVQTVGANAETPRRGLLVDSVIKSGGNDFHGTAVLYGSGPNLESNNIDDTLKAAGIIPSWVQIGNETNNGMLWPAGQASTFVSRQKKSSMRWRPSSSSPAGRRRRILRRAFRQTRAPKMVRTSFSGPAARSAIPTFWAS